MFMQKLFICIFGISSFSSFVYGDESRIVGGYDAAAGEFPYQISLRKCEHHICGGSILNENWILTAAHCVYGMNPAELSVVAGSHLLNTSGDLYNVMAISSHSSYASCKTINDIALIRTEKAIKFSSLVQPIKLPIADTPEDTELILSGWGSTTYPGKAPNTLQAIKLYSIKNEECAKEHPLDIKDGNICTFTKIGEGACHGDSGGPLVDDGVQVGVVSWGIPCAKGKPDVFTRVYYYRNWIEENMK